MKRSIKIFVAPLFCFVVLMACLPNAYAAPAWPPYGGWGNLCSVKSFHVTLTPGVNNYSGTANCQVWVAYSDVDGGPYGPLWLKADVTFDGSYDIKSKKYVEHIYFELGQYNWNEIEGSNNIGLNGGGTCNDDPWRTTTKCDGYTPGSIVKSKYSWDLVPLETEPLSRYIFGFSPGGLQKLVASSPSNAVAIDPMAKPQQSSTPKGGKQVGGQKTMSMSGGTTGAATSRSAATTAVRWPLPDLAFGYVIVGQRTYSVAGGVKPIILSYFTPSRGNPSGGCERPYSFPLKVTVQNIGQADFAPKDSSQAVAVNIGPWNSAMDLKKIGKGYSQSMDFNVTLPPGQYTLKAVIDLHNGVAESRADNNTLSWPLEVKCDPMLLPPAHLAPAALPSGAGGKQMLNPQPQPPKENAQGKQLPAVQR